MTGPTVIGLVVAAAVLFTAAFAMSEASVDRWLRRRARQRSEQAAIDEWAETQRQLRPRSYQ